MSAKRSRALRAGVEALEQRETPSTHALAAAAATTTVTINGTGTAHAIQSHPVVNGRVITSAASGTATVIGKYTATFETFFRLNYTQGTGTGIITAADGDKINLSLKASFAAGSRSLVQNPGTIHFTVTGGTGAFAKATGTGTLTGNGDLVRQSFVYTIHSRIHEQ
jgi:hypothetical protein